MSSLEVGIGGGGAPAADFDIVGEDAVIVEGCEDGPVAGERSRFTRHLPIAATCSRERRLGKQWSVRCCGCRLLSLRMTEQWRKTDATQSLRGNQLVEGRREEKL